jgi:hypothetical protein
MIACKVQLMRARKTEPKWKHFGNSEPSQANPPAVAGL